MSSKPASSSEVKTPSQPPSTSSSLGKTREMLLFLIDPWLFMASSLYYLPGTITDLVLSHEFRALFSWEAIQTRWFGRFWSWAGPVVRRTAERLVVPLLEGRVADGTITEHAVKPGVHGVVIEVGAGSGMWVELFRNGYHSKFSEKEDDAAGTTSGAASAIDESAYDLVSRKRASAASVGDKASPLGRGPITKVYGVEPNPQSHKALTQRVKDAGLEGIYEVVPVGIEHIGSGHWKWDKKIEPESVDCIVSILCLCSIPDPEDNIRTLYQYLKPGGRWYTFEHVCYSGKMSRGMKWYQWLINLFWPHLMGGCILTRDTERSLRGAGSWSEIDVAPPRDEPWYAAVPHLYGILTK